MHFFGGNRLVLDSLPNFSPWLYQLTSIRNLNRPGRERQFAVRDIEGALYAGSRRRAKIIPFTRTFRGDEVDPDLPKKLSAEASGILNFMLRGAQDYLVNGLVEPKKVTAAIAEERESVDTVAAFLKDTMRTDVDDETPMKMIFQMNENWRAQNHTYVRLTKQALGKGLVEKGFKKSERGHCVYHHGLIPFEVPDQS